MSTTSGSIFSAVYDYRSRRLEKTENSSTVSYLYDGGVSVQEYDGQGSLTKVLVRGSGYGGGIGSVIYTADDANGTNRRFFLYNALGSTSAMTNDAMTVTSTSSYDGWGKEIGSTGSSETDRKFCTKERSASIGLDYFGFRYYDYDLGRFSTRDPAGYPDGLNNYLYCNNDPVNKIDPLGLRTIKDYKAEIDKQRQKMNSEVDKYMDKHKNPYQKRTKKHSQYNKSIRKGLEKIYDKHHGIITKLEKKIDHIKGTTAIYHDAVARRYEELQKEYGDNIPKEELKTLTILDVNKLDDESKPFKKLENFAGKYFADIIMGKTRDEHYNAIVLSGLASAVVDAGVKTYRLYKAKKTVDNMTKWLGKDAKTITNPAGDKIFISKDGLRKIRFDINRTTPHTNPHGHVEILKNGKWVKSGPIYPKGVTKH